MNVEEALKILDVDHKATISEIKENYKWLVKFYHPDNKKTGSSKHFQETIIAYKTIKGNLSND